MTVRWLLWFMGVNPRTGDRRVYYRTPFWF